MYPSNTSYHIRQECGPCPCPHLLRHPHHQRGKTEGGKHLSSTIQRMKLKCGSQVLEFYRPFSHTFSRNLCLSFVLSKRTVFSKASAAMLERMLTAIIADIDLAFCWHRKYLSKLSRYRWATRRLRRCWKTSHSGKGHSHLTRLTWERDEAFQVLKMSPSSELFKTDFYLKQEVKLTHPGGDAEESGDKIQREGE